MCLLSLSDTGEMYACSFSKAIYGLSSSTRAGVLILCWMLKEFLTWN